MRRTEPATANDSELKTSAEPVPDYDWTRPMKFTTSS